MKYFFFFWERTIIFHKKINDIKWPFYDFGWMDKQKYIVAKTWATDVKVFVLELLLTWKSGGDENCVGGWWSPRVSQCICPYYLNGIKWLHQRFANWIFFGLTRKKKYSIANISLAIFGEYIILYGCMNHVCIITMYIHFHRIFWFQRHYAVCIAIFGTWVCVYVHSVHRPHHLVFVDANDKCRLNWPY